MNLKNIFNCFSESGELCVILLRRLFSSHRLDYPVIKGWSDLPSDILRCVASRLELVDQIRLRAVCRSWHEIEEIGIPNDKLPWLFVLNESRFERFERKNGKSGSPHYYLYDVHNEKLYSVWIQQQSTRWRFLNLRLWGIKCVKLGWLLVKDWSRLHLFNPFTQEVIDLPEGQKPLNFLFTRTYFTFRYCPKSGRLLVYAVSEYVTDGLVLIGRWKSGDRWWESNYFAVEFPSVMKRIMKIEPVGEALYCVFENGVVGRFDERHRTWSVVVKYREDDKLFSTVNALFDYYSYTFEFKGELLLMDIRHIHRLAFANGNSPRKCYLWRLDKSKGRWVRVVRFHKCAIFYSKYRPPFPAVLCSERFIEASDPVATRIYNTAKPCNGITISDYNQVHPIRKNKFPWCQGKSSSDNLPFLWIEPYPFLAINTH